MKTRKKTRRKGIKADYGDATPSQVAEALLRYRPGKSAGEVWETPPEYRTGSAEST